MGFQFLFRRVVGVVLPVFFPGRSAIGKGSRAFKQGRPYRALHKQAADVSCVKLELACLVLGVKELILNYHIMDI